MGIKVEPNRGLRGNLTHQLVVAKKLLGFVETTMLAWQTPPHLDRRKAAILMALADKSFRTFETIHYLMETTIAVDDAGALLRILYESVLNAAFLLNADNQTVDNYADFFMYRNQRDHELFAQIDPATAEAALTREETATMRRHSDSVKGRYSHGKWTTVSIEDMAKKADEQFPPGFKVFAYLYAGIYRQLSAHVHSDVRSIQGRIRESEDGGPVWIQRAVSDTERARVMHAANFLMFAICFTVTSTFYGNRYVPDWNSLVLQWNGNEKVS